MNEQENQHVPEDVQEFAGKLFELARTGDVVLLDYCLLYTSPSPRD